MVENVITSGNSTINLGSPTSGMWTGGISCEISGIVRLEIQCTINGTHLNQPKTISSPWPTEKLSSPKSCPW